MDNNHKEIEEIIEEFETELERERIEQVENYWKVPSFNPEKRKQGIFYWVVKFKNGEWACDCWAYLKKGDCKHIQFIKGQLKKKNEKENYINSSEG